MFVVAVVTEDQVAGVSGIDPECMIVDVDGVARRAAIHDRVELERLAAVNRDAEPGENIVDPVRIIRVSSNFRVVEGALGDIVFLVGPGPAQAAVVRSQHGAFFCFNQGIDPAALRSGWSKCDSSEVTLGQTVVHGLFVPVFSAIPRDVHS